MKVPVKIIKEGDRYIAQLGIGWWIGTGKTPKKALENAKDKYFKEYERQGIYHVSS